MAFAANPVMVWLVVWFSITAKVQHDGQLFHVDTSGVDIGCHLHPEAGDHPIHIYTNNYILCDTAITPVTVVITFLDISPFYYFSPSTMQLLYMQ